MATNLVFSVQKAFKVLDLLVFEDTKEKGLRLSEISQRTNIKPNTLHNILRTMIVQKYVQQYEDGNYGAGPKIDQIYILRQISSNEHEYGPLNILESLRDDIKENVIFAVLSDGKWQLVKEFTYEADIQINNDRFVKSGLYEMATGRVMTAFCSESELTEVLNANGLPGSKWDDIESLDVLNDARGFIRKKGWFDMYTQNDQLWAIGIPVLNKREKLIGAIGCAAPAFRCDEKKKNYIRTKFMELAIEIREIMNADK